jgi:hypothetical protein
MNGLRLAALALAVCILSPACEASVTISTMATQNMTCSAGVCSPTAKKAGLNVNDLTNMLATGDVKITTGAGAVTITVESPFSWTSTSQLTLDADGKVTFRAPVTVAGTGAVTIHTGFSRDDLLFFPGGKLDFWDTSSGLAINGSAYSLAIDIKTLAAEIAADPHGLYALANDYDASADGRYSRPPIATEFYGTVEGLGHVISSLLIHDGRGKRASVGLFGLLRGTVRDINLEMRTSPIIAIGGKIL